jgi:L-alanine-DL-glutamate epimerase-like enolase superfamily enzyme
MNVREAVGDDIDIAMHCLAQFDPRSAIGLCKAVEPADLLWIEDPLPTLYSEAWLELKRSTRVPVLTGERIELVGAFKPFLDNQVAYDSSGYGVRRRHHGLPRHRQIREPDARSGWLP